MSILAALFAVSLSLTSPSQYTFTSNLFDQSFFTGTGYGNTESPPYRTLRLEDAAFLTEAFWERTCAHYLSSSGLESHSIKTLDFKGGSSTNYTAAYMSPDQAIRDAIRESGACYTNSATYRTGIGYIFGFDTNKFNKSFFCNSTADAFIPGFHDCGTDNTYAVNGVTTIQNIRPLVSDGAVFGNSFPTNLWRYMREDERDKTIHGEYLRSSYQLLDMIDGGAQAMPISTYDYIYYNDMIWRMSYTPTEYAEYTWTYTDVYGEEQPQIGRYPVQYKRTELDYPDVSSGSNYIGVVNHTFKSPYPRRWRYRETERLYGFRLHSYRAGETQMSTVIDNGYVDVLDVSQNRHDTDNRSVITFKIDGTTNMYKAHRNGTQYGNLKVFLIAKGTARTIHTQTYSSYLDAWLPYDVTCTTNATRFVNVSKATATLTVDGDNMKIEFPGSIQAMAGDAVDSNLKVFSNMPYPTSLVPTNFGGETCTEGGAYSHAKDEYVAEIVYDSIECYIQSSPTYHARVL